MSATFSHNSPKRNRLQTVASPFFFDASLVDTLACNQLCQWSTVGAAEGCGTNEKDTLLLASHLIIHLPPRVGAYVLASHSDLARITPDTTSVETNSRSQFQVRQNAQFRSPQHLAQPQAAIEAAREQAILTLSVAKSPGRFGSPCRPRRKEIRKLTTSQTLHSTLPATIAQRRFATPFHLPLSQLCQTISHPMLASSVSLTQLTVTRTSYKTQLLRPPILLFDGYKRALLVSHPLSGLRYSPILPESTVFVL